MQLSGVGFVALGYTRNLEMSHIAYGQVVTNFFLYIALDYLTVVKIELYFQVSHAHLFDDGVGIVLSVQKKVWNVPGVDGFDQHIPPCACGLLAGPTQVADIGVA